ncbi:LAMI_0G14246g1_1 [Lachancea mirantina]|uniref:mitogen-activated protein kinase kinase n=1 Tax=Lachancea mirantina TaxID=1230905 RepID=A0A1G4KC42_9SACH|nr:LAMI_0G14246g1_1 [Lachancea mirantina]
MERRKSLSSSEELVGSKEIRRTPSTSSQYNNINANLHARVKAFQEQRQLKRNGSVGSDKAVMAPLPVADLATAVGSTPVMPAPGIDKVVNKPLPPLPPPSRESDAVLNPIRRAPRPPALPMAAVPLGNMARGGPGAAVGMSKPSLSARRGLKLPAGGMSLKMKQPSPHEFAGAPSNAQQPAGAAAPASSRSNPGSLVNGVQTTSTSSNKQRDTEGTTPAQQRSGSNGLFTNFTKYVDIKSGSLNFAGKLSLSSQGVDFSNGSSFRITLDELEFLEELGHGNYGNVSKVLHKPTNVIMAMKEVRLELDESKFTQILMELEVLHKCQSPYIVDFYGAFFIEGAVYMCMEYMDGGSLDKSYDQATLGGVDEPQLAKITDAVIQGLKELKDVHNIIHRDVKPTNILCSAAQGTVKLCDFGVSGNLVASLAKTNIGCQSYMAPERIKSLNPDKATYTVQSDVWSLGLSILEMALGAYPYPPETYDNIFSQLSAIVDSPPPKLPKDRFSQEAQDFVNMCLQKIPERRPGYAALLEHPWLKKYRSEDVHMSEYITKRLEKREALLKANGGQDTNKNVPALHMGGL